PGDWLEYAPDEEAVEALDVEFDSERKSEGVGRPSAMAMAPASPAVAMADLKGAEAPEVPSAREHVQHERREDIQIPGYREPLEPRLVRVLDDDLALAAEDHGDHDADVEVVAAVVDACDVRLAAPPRWVCFLGACKQDAKRERRRVCRD